MGPQIQVYTCTHDAYLCTLISMCGGLCTSKLELRIEKRTPHVHCVVSVGTQPRYDVPDDREVDIQ